MIKNFRNPLFYFSICASFVLSSSSIASSKSLTEQECRLIQEYNNTLDNSFTDHFTNMVHQRGFCRASGGSCEVSLQKRVDNYYFFMSKSTFFDSKIVAKTAETEMIKTLLQIIDATGLEPIFERPEGTDQPLIDKYVHVAFILPDEVDKDFDKYFDEIIPTNTSKPIINSVKKVFKSFLEDDQYCMRNSALSDDGIIRNENIWIRSNLDKTKVQLCVSEMLYSSFGLDSGDPNSSIFASMFGRTPGDYSLSKFDLLKLKILYRDEFRPGMTKVETRKTTGQLLLNECSKL